MQALAAAGGSITNNPDTPREASPALLSSPAIAKSTITKSPMMKSPMAASPGGALSSVGVDPPPPSLDCLDRTNSIDSVQDRQVICHR